MVACETDTTSRQIMLRERPWPGSRLPTAGERTLRAAGIMALPDAHMEFFEAPGLLDRVIMTLVWLVAIALVFGLAILLVLLARVVA